MTLGEPKLSPLLRECVRASKMRLLHDNDDDFHYSDFLKFEEWKSFLNCFKASSAASFFFRSNRLRLDYYCGAEEA